MQRIANLALLLNASTEEVQTMLSRILSHVPAASRKAVLSQLVRDGERSETHRDTYRHLLTQTRQCVRIDAAYR